MSRLLPKMILFALVFAFSEKPAPAQTSQRGRISAPAALLDDYEVAAPGSLTIGLSAFYGRVKSGDDRALPGADLSLGLTRWMELSAYSSLVKSRFGDFVTTALGDSLVAAKFKLLREGRRRPGVAFQPVLEVLGRPSLANNTLAPPKVNAAFGGIVGKSFNILRIYNHSGYFTRGIFFSSAAVELTLFPRITPVAYMTFGALAADRELAASLLNNASQAGLGGTLGFRLTRNWTGYVTGGRGIGRRDLNSAEYHLGGGLSRTVQLWGAP